MLTCESHENTIRWQEGERLEHLFEERCDTLNKKRGGADRPAIIVKNTIVTYQELDERANQLARYLLKQGIKSGDRIGILLDKSINTYVSLLAVLKANAAYVPLDPSFPSKSGHPLKRLLKIIPLFRKYEDQPIETSCTSLNKIRLV